jgi:hypothetical protein
MAIEVPAPLRARGPAVPTPVRRPGSIRRTSTIDATWPDGFEQGMHLLGRARDLVTPADGSAPLVIAEDVMLAEVAPDRTVRAIASIPERSGLAALVGTQGGSGSRKRIADAVPDEVRNGTPLYLLLDDLPGATLVSGFARKHWQSHEEFLQLREQGPQRSVVGICAGFQPGASAVAEDGSSRPIHQVQVVPFVVREDDPWAWHDLADINEVSSRRSRRVDVWFEDGLLQVDAFFQDAGTSPSGARIAVHEYTIHASADPQTFEVLAIEAVPQVLPFNECPLAATNVHRLVGSDLRDFRRSVNELLPGILGCTHMNDALRSIAEAPVLATKIR